MEGIVSALTTRAAVVLGYWFAILSQDRERDVRAQAASELLRREVGYLRHAAQACAPDIVTAAAASSHLDLHPWTEELVGRPEGCQ